jgi:hypothetical protein
VDLEAPTVFLSAAFQAALADGFLGPDELVYTGELEDNLDASAVALCLNTAGVERCSRQLANPGGAPLGAWLYRRLGVVGFDGVAETLTLVGIDGAGNRSQPLTAAYQLDVVAPALAVTSSLRAVELGDYDGVGQSGPPVLAGSVTDGGGVDRVVVRLEGPDGTVVWQETVISGSDWHYTPVFEVAGEYLMWVEAYDLAGNSSARGVYRLEVTGSSETIFYLPAVSR